MVIPSVEWLKIWSTPGRTPARSSRSLVRTPSQRAAPTYGPPTSFETQVRVMSRSTSGIVSSSSKVSENGRSTSPSTVSFQPSTETRGITRAVSIR